MTTRYVWDRDSVKFPASNFPEMGVEATTRLSYLAFDPTTDEICYLEGIAPQGLTGTLTLVVYGYMASAVTGTVGLRAAVEAVTPGDALDRDASSSFDSINYATSATVPGTAGHEFSTTITLTNADSLAAGDDFRIEFGRDADGTGSTDSATGDFKVTRIELRDEA
jgi:hypothetical protein